MEANFTDETTGEPKDPENEYGEYIKNCMDREAPIGGFTDDNDNDGEECIQGSASKNLANDTNGVLAKACEKKATLASTRAAKTECMKNARAVNANPATNPNCSSGDEGGDTECRRNMFRIFYIDLSVNEGMDNGEVANNSSSNPNSVSGDAKELAQQVANNANIILREETRAQLINFSEGKPVFNECGKEMTISKHLLGALLANATKYKITVNNFGFKEDRHGTDDCGKPTRQHPLGTAVDLNNIEIIGGASTGGNISLPGSDLAVVNAYATDFLKALPLNRGGVGQKDHGVNPTFPPGSVALNGSHLFPDAGNHLHIDARNRENLTDTE